MQVSKVNINVPNQKAKHNNGRQIKNNTQSFKGVGAGLDKFALGVADLIENGGLFVSFTLQDMLGTNLPRPIMGLRRNQKENKGENNMRFAAKEFVREFLTGPSMFIIPATMLACAKKMFGKTINTPADAIKALGEIHAAQPLNAVGEAISKQEFIKNAFTEIIKNAKAEVAPSKETIEKASEFTKKLLETAQDKQKSKEAIQYISSEFVNISKNAAKDTAHTDFTLAALSKNMSVNIKNAISYISSYADDVVLKAQNISKEELTQYIKNIANKKVVGRFAMNAAMFAAVMTFLQYIPKWYNKAEGQDNAGLKGLMKEQTLKDESAGKETKDKSKPSFGSAATIANSITGSGVAGKLARAIEFEGFNLSFPLLMTAFAGGLIYPRMKNAKDKYDREEIFRRDVTSCVVMGVGEKILRKCFSKANETKSGFVLASKAQGFENQSVLKKVTDYLRPVKGVRVLSTDQIVSKYSNIGEYNEGIKGFCDFISGQGGNLGKVFSLTDESKVLVEKLLPEGKNIANADNKVITEALEKAKDSEEIKKLIDLFKQPNNPWVKKAKTLNARFTALSVLLIVPLCLGFLLPWINEKTTKRKFKEEHEAISNANKLASLEHLDYKPSNIFNDVANFGK